MADNGTTRSCLMCRIGYSAVGILIGISAFVFWLVKIEPTVATTHTAAFGGLSGVLAAWNMITHIMHLQDFWRTWLRGLRWFMVCGMVFVVLTVAAFVIYLVLAITYKPSIELVGSFYITCVWCFISFKWAAFLLYHSRSYRNEFSDLTALLEF